MCVATIGKGGGIQIPFFHINRIAAQHKADD